MATFLQSVRVCHAAEDQQIIDQFGCGHSEDEPDCTGLCLLLTFIVITVIVIIVIVIIIFFFFFLPTITQRIVCRSNDGTCEVS